MPAARAHRALPLFRRALGAAWLVLTRVGALFVLLQAYTTLRKTYFVRPAAVAFDHALDLLALQAALRIDVELQLQRWALEQAWLIELANAYYRQMKLGVYLSAALALLLAPTAFRRVGSAFVLATLLAFPWYALYPLAPPRFMGPYGYPFVDTLAAWSPVPPAGAGLAGANPYAAMPSMHIGWTIFAALWLAAALPWRRIGPILGSLHVALMCGAVVITGNHYVLDVVAGFAVAGAALGLARLLPRPGIVPRLGGRVSRSTPADPTSDSVLRPGAPTLVMRGPSGSGRSAIPEGAAPSAVGATIRDEGRGETAAVTAGAADRAPDASPFGVTR